MTCDECQEILSADLDGEADAAETAAAAAHTAGCLPCYAHARALRELQVRLSRWPEEALPARAATAAESPRRRRVRGGLVAASILFALGVGYAAGRVEAARSLAVEPPVAAPSRLVSRQITHVGTGRTELVTVLPDPRSPAGE